MATIGGRPRILVLDDDGNPLKGGLVFTYEAGTTTKKTTYQDAAETTPNSNPIELDSRGEATVYWDTGTYKVVVASSTDSDPPTAPIWTEDNYSPSSNALTNVIVASSSNNYVNWVEVSNAVTGNHPNIKAAGDGTDANINLELETTGTGVINCKDPVTIDTGPLTLTSGNAVLTSGNLTITSGNITLTSGDLTLTSGNLTLTSGNLAVTGTGAVNTSLTINGTAATQGSLIMGEDTDNGSNTVTIQPPAAITSSFTLTLPDGDGDNTEFTTTDGSGVLSWTSINDLTVDASPDSANDYIMTYDASAGVHKKVTVGNISGATSSFDYELISSATASSSATIDFTGLSSDYILYRIVFTNVKPATDDTALNLLTSTDNGSSFDNSAGNYAVDVGVANNTNLNNDSLAVIQLNPVGTSEGMGNGTNESASGYITIFNPSATEYTQTEHKMTYVGAGGGLISASGSGMRKDTTAVDAVRIQMNSGNIASGEFRLYGLKAT